MTTFLALYRGDTIMSSELVAVSADQRLVRDFAARLVTDEPTVGNEVFADEPSPHRNGSRENDNYKRRIDI